MWGPKLCSSPFVHGTYCTSTCHFSSGSVSVMSIVLLELVRYLKVLFFALMLLLLLVLHLLVWSLVRIAFSLAVFVYTILLFIACLSCWYLLTLFQVVNGC